MFFSYLDMEISYMLDPIALPNKISYMLDPNTPTSSAYLVFLKFSQEQDHDSWSRLFWFTMLNELEANSNSTTSFCIESDVWVHNALFLLSFALNHVTCVFKSNNSNIVLKEPQPYFFGNNSSCIVDWEKQWLWNYFPDHRWHIFPKIYMFYSCRFGQSFC